MKHDKHILLIIFVGVAALGGLAGCSEQKARPVKLPPAQYPAEPEMEAFVDEVLSGQEPNAQAIGVFYATLDRDEQRSLEHELNFMLKVRGSKKRFSIPEAGRVVESPPGSANRELLNALVKAVRRQQSYDLQEINRLLVAVQMHDGNLELERHLTELNTRLARLGKRVQWDGKELSVVAR